MKNLMDALTLAENIQKTEGLEAQINFYKNLLAQKVFKNDFVLKFNLASALSGNGDLEEAETIFSGIAKNFPGFVNVHFNLGIVYDRLKRFDEALLAWSKAIEVADVSVPEQRKICVQSLNQSARVQEERKNYARSKAHLERSLELEPNQPPAIQHLVRARQMLCDWPVLAPAAMVREYDMLMATSPLAMLAIEDCPKAQLLTAYSFVNRTYDLKRAPLPPSALSKKKVRLGYVSGDFCTHAVGLLLPDYLSFHDKTKFEVYCYDYGVRDGTQLRATLLSRFDILRDISTISDEDAAKLIAADGIDILFDMHGLSAKARPHIFAMRPAKIQVSWLGYIGTTALPWLDYLLLDKYSFLEVDRVYFSEKIIAIDSSFLPGRTTQIASLESMDAKKRPDRDTRIFGCLNNVYKINPNVIRVWARMLNDVRESKLILSSVSADVNERIISEFAIHGVQQHRVSFLERQTYQAYTETLREIDLYLDTFPYCAGSVARDVVEACTPMVTLAGRTPISRMAAGILAELGLENLIATTEEQYVEIAIRALYESNNYRDHLKKFYLSKGLDNEKKRCQLIENQLLECLRSLH